MTKMKIEVGEYVRTKYGITQFKAYETMNGNKLLCIPVKDGSNGIFANIEDIIKSSPNIIDLIEVGDYVNGEKIQFINRGNLITEGGYDLLKKYNEITAIVTKQQFSNMEYRL